MVDLKAGNMDRAFTTANQPRSRDTSDDDAPEDRHGHSIAHFGNWDYDPELHEEDYSSTDVDGPDLYLSEGGDGWESSSDGAYGEYT